MIPDWAPNLHPMAIHFPIVLVLVATAVDVLDFFVERPAWSPALATILHAAGATAAIVAYLTGIAAASDVFIPGMAHPPVDDHQAWALATTGYVMCAALGRILLGFSRSPRQRRRRVLLLASGLLAAILVQQTAERGARLVYDFGVGVIAAPGSR